MLGLPLVFTVPLALVALIGLPALYILLRITPPRPRRVPFPPLKLILDLQPKDETPANTPWWLLLLRLAIAAAIILAMAGPIWNPFTAGLEGDGPLLIVIDDGWAAAPSWDRRVVAAAQRIEAARQNSLPIAIAAVSDAGKDVVPVDAPKALERLRALKPAPFTPDRLAEWPAIERFVAAHPRTALTWIADGLERGNARAFAEKLAALPIETTLVADGAPVLALADPRNGGGGLDVRVLRSLDRGASRGFVRALDLKGLTVGQAPFVFMAPTEAKAHFDLPIELRNDIARLELVDGHSAGGVSLLDARWKRRRVGIVSGETADTAQPLLAPNYYLLKALSPFADVHEAKPGTPDPIGSLLDDHVSVLILADVGTIGGATRDRLSQFVDAGGTLVRFAGTRLSAVADDLVPVRLRRGGRVLGGSLSWEQPKRLAPFEPPSPFVGLKVPAEVTISRQVLAEPDAGLPGKTWAQLSDGTPLVTADTRGKGKVVLFHVTADTTWSNLPISGLFVDMLRAIVAMAGETNEVAAANEAAPAAVRKVETVPPTRILDGFGLLGPPPPTAKPIPMTFVGVSSAEHPPGFYGAAESLLAINVLAPTDSLPPARLADLRFKTAPLQSADPIDLRPWLILGAFVMFLIDSLASLWLAGKMPRLPRRVVAAGLVIALGCLVAPGFLPAAQAQSAQADGKGAAKSDAVSRRDLASALTTRLAYVISGDARVDEISRQGLATLSTTLANRTSLNPGEPIGVDPARDDLAFYPLLYWPVVASASHPSAEASARIAAFMRQGGTIVFDTRDALSVRPSGLPSPETAWLRDFLADIDVPELEPVPPSHVVTKTFYLIDSFVGRYTAGQTWIEALPPAIGEAANRPARSGDGVSPIVVTGNDLAGGWAGDDYGEALYPLVPGDPRQHEMALRGGVNLVMYTLTGNYKADQVHVRDLLERLAH